MDRYLFQSNTRRDEVNLETGVSVLCTMEMPTRNGSFWLTVQNNKYKVSR